MNDTPQPPACNTLTELQAARIDFARRDLDYARSEDLAALEPASLILLIERLRTRLDDVLRIVDEATQPEPPNPRP